MYECMYVCMYSSPENFNTLGPQKFRFVILSTNFQ